MLDEVEQAVADGEIQMTYAGKIVPPTGSPRMITHLSKFFVNVRQSARGIEVMRDADDIAARVPGSEALLRFEHPMVRRVPTEIARSVVGAD